MNKSIKTILALFAVVLVAVIFTGSLQESTSSTPATRLSEEEVINIAQDYVTNTLLPREKSKLLEKYPPPTSEDSEGYKIENLSADIQTEEIKKIEEPALWAVPVCFSHQITKPIDTGGRTNGVRCNPKLTIYVDDVTGTVIPELAKIGDISVFEYCDKPIGINIQFDVASITTYYWTESEVLEDICICRKKDTRECGNKPIDPAAYNYTAEKTDDWNKSKENILNSCEGFSFIGSIKLKEDGGDYFMFQIDANQWSDAAGSWVKRKLVRQGGWIPLKFEKETGKIFEQRRSINSSAYAEYENTLITEHNAEKLYHSGWKIPPSELINITKYDWIIKIEPDYGGVGSGAVDEKNPTTHGDANGHESDGTFTEQGTEEKAPGLGIWTGLILAATIAIVMHQKKRRL